MPGQYTDLVDWNEERVALLKSLYADGLSGGQIAAELGGISRNAVIGKVHRLGLQRRGNSTAQATVARIQQKARPERTVPFKPKPVARPAPAPRRKPVDLDDVPQEMRDLPADQSPHAVRFLDRNGDACRWPLNDVVPIADHMCCGAPTGGDSYCRRHAMLATTRAHKPYSLSDTELARRRQQGALNFQKVAAGDHRSKAWR